MKPIVCQHCGSERGFFIKEQVRGSAIIHYTKEGHYCKENGQVYDSVRHFAGKLAYCLSCEKRIGKSAELISGLNESDMEENY